MSEIWETFDDLFRAMNRQDRRVTELENRLARLEKDLQLRAETVTQQRLQQFARLERAWEKAA